MEIQCQIIFIKHRFWKIHELEILYRLYIGTLQRILQKISEECSRARTHLVAFRQFHTFVCIANQPWTAVKNSSREKNYRKMNGSSKHDWTLSGTATSLHFFPLKSFSLCQKFPIHKFFRSDVLWKLFDIGFPYRHCTVILRRVCLPIKMPSKTVIRSIEGRTCVLKSKVVQYHAKLLFCERIKQINFATVNYCVGHNWFGNYLFVSDCCGLSLPSQ